VQIIGDGNITKESRVLQTFNEIKIDGSVNLIAICGSAQKVELEADSNLISLIKTDVINKTLHVYSDKNYSSKNKQVLYISIENLSKISLNGSSSIKISDLSNELFEIIINGSGNIIADGKTKVFMIDINGSGSIQSENTESENVNIKISGSGNAEVKAIDTLNISIRGSGHVIFYGNPNIIKQEIHGSGSITKR
jgi:hypothetical protein